MNAENENGENLIELKTHFDESYYIAQYPDVARARLDPFQHYITQGWKENREPFENFHSIMSKLLPDDYSEDTMPLAKYHELMEAKKSHIEFNETLSLAGPTHWYKSQSEVWADNILQLLECLGYDKNQIKNIPLGSHIRKLFDPEYVRVKMQLSDTVGDAECFVRYVSFGLPNGLPSTAFFHEETYIENVSKSTLMSLGKERPFLHFLTHGIFSDISPSPFFSPTEYLHINPDLRSFPGSMLYHFIMHGIEERRQFNRKLTLAEGLSFGQSNSILSFFRSFGDNDFAHEEFDSQAAFIDSNLANQLIRAAQDIEPLIIKDDSTKSYLPPLHDFDYVKCKTVFQSMPDSSFDTVILMPFCKMGGADYVSSVLLENLKELGKNVLIIQTDQDEWDKPEWFGNVTRFNLYEFISDTTYELSTRILYEVLRKIKPSNIFNINSRLAFDTIDRFGRHLKLFSKLHVYYFCPDRTPSNEQTGYPIWYFAAIFDHVTTSITDSKALAAELTNRYMLEKESRTKVTCLYTPSKTELPTSALVDYQISSSNKRKRQRVMWAGRFDRQKRFDILIDVARSMPNVDFHAWGKAVLDTPPDTNNLPKNITLHGPFATYNELPLLEVDCFLYTSDWDGIPTILIEVGVLGMPIVASASGGVPELIDDSTGWLVPLRSGGDSYVEALEEALGNHSMRKTRAKALQERIIKQHNKSDYQKKLIKLMG